MEPSVVRLGIVAVTGALAGVRSLAAIATAAAAANPFGT